MPKKKDDTMAWLHAEEEETFRDGLASLEGKGTLSMLDSLVDCYLNTAVEFKKRRLHLFLSSITKKGIREAWLGMVHEETNLSKKTQLINILWNSRIDFSPYLLEFVRWAGEGDYTLTLECLTLVEQMEGPFQEEQLLGSICLVRDYLQSHSEMSDQKKALLQSLAEHLNGLNQADATLFD
jgi:hypothetical protein